MAETASPIATNTKETDVAPASTPKKMAATGAAIPSSALRTVPALPRSSPGTRDWTRTWIGRFSAPEIAPMAKKIRRAT